MEEINNWIWDGNNNKICYFKSLKENIIRQNENINFLLHNIHETKLDIDLLKGIGEIEIDDNYSYNIDIHLKDKLKNNNKILMRIDSKLKSICKHNFIDDYIEAGIEQEMIKIRYCEICNITE